MGVFTQRPQHQRRPAARCTWRACRTPSVRLKRPRPRVGSTVDADRASVFVCESGKIVNGDGVISCRAPLPQIANKLQGPDRVVVPRCPNLGLSAFLGPPRRNNCVAPCRVAHRYVLEEMLSQRMSSVASSPATDFFSTTARPGDGCFTAAKNLPRLVSMHCKT